MSKKTFVTIALTLNVIICVTICIIYFNGNGKHSMEKSDQYTSATDKESDSTMSAETTTILEHETTTIDSQTTTNQETTSQIETTLDEQATAPSYTINKTKANISSACNIRDGASVSSNVIGVTKTGEEYRINAMKCDRDWVAIEYNGTIGYISTGYCTLN